MKEKVSSVIVTFNPDKERLLAEIEVLRRWAVEIIIVDNTEGGWKDVPRGVELISFGENKGVATALNEGFKKAIGGGAAWILSFDQDSLPPEDMLEKYLDFMASHPAAGQIGPLYSGMKQKEDSKVDHVITSGAMTSAKAFSEVGGFRDELFIDMVDIDFSYRLRDAGFEVWRTSGVMMEHNLGDGRKGLLIKGKLRLVYIEHSPVRWYYMTRNALAVCPHTYISRKLFKNILKMLLFGEEKLLKIRYILRGIKDFRRGVFGKFREETR